MAKHQYLRNRMTVIPLLDGQTLPKSWFDFKNRTQSEARDLPTSEHERGIQYHVRMQVVFITSFDDVYVFLCLHIINISQIVRLFLSFLAT